MVVPGFLLAVLAVVAAPVAATAASDEVEVALSPPAGWRLDQTASAELTAKTREAFFAGAGIEADAEVYRAPEDPERTTLAVQVVVTSSRQTADELVDLVLNQLAPGRPVTRRVEDGRVIAESTLTEGDYTSRLAVHAMRGSANGLVMTVVCRERRDQAACAPVIRAAALVNAPEPAGGIDWRMWLEGGGSALLAIGLVGWRLERRRRRR